jgi:hypothetical protein
MPKSFSIAVLQKATEFRSGHWSYYMLEGDISSIKIFVYIVWFLHVVSEGKYSDFYQGEE